MPWSADAPVGTASEKTNEKAMDRPSWTPHSQANEDVGAPASAPEWYSRRYLSHRSPTQFGSCPEDYPNPPS
ncbi:MAG: hypothetical protein ORN51_03330 [Akkermansiaceae bacterium]|nr:hypothetical protein [Akkermansiaceae bacterium]